MDFSKAFKKARIVKKKYKGDVYILLKPMGTRAFFELQRGCTQSGPDGAAGKLDELKLSIDIGYTSLVGWEGVEADGVKKIFNEENKAILFDADQKFAVFVVEEAMKLIDKESKRLKGDKKNS